MGVEQSVTVKTLPNGWLLTKQVDGKTITATVTDANNNGYLDNADNFPTTEGFTQAELLAVKENIFNATNPSKGNTVGDFLNGQDTVAEEEKKAEAFEMQQLELRRKELEAQLGKTKKKKGFWNKLFEPSQTWANINVVGSTVLGGLSGFMNNSWQYGSGDSGLRMMSTLTGALQGASTVLAQTYQQQAYDLLSKTMGNQVFNPNQVSKQDVLKAKSDELEAKIAEATKLAAQREKLASTLYEKANEENTIVDAVNRAKIDEIYQPENKKAKDYTVEDANILKVIAQTPAIPYDAVSIDGADNSGKLDFDLATKVNAVLVKYEQLTKKYEDTPISTEEHQKLRDLLSKAQQGSLSGDDVKEIQKIVAKANSATNKK